MAENVTGFRAEDDLEIKRVVITVTDKTFLGDFASRLDKEFGVTIISTGKTAKFLREERIYVTPVETLTGFPEMLNGRVKTLDPRIYAPILTDKTNEKHMTELVANKMIVTDMVVCNLYEFEKAVAKPNIAFKDLMEEVDIGGHSLLRAAAKNFSSVAVVSSIGQYARVAEEMALNKGKLSYKTRLELAKNAFDLVTLYDLAISRELEKRVVSETSYSKRLEVNFMRTLVAASTAHPILRSDSAPERSRLKH
jgi:phosphoribosylaminoimidazolecarboxamide formyltransferase / IMP cyclohydrolase